MLEPDVERLKYVGLEKAPNVCCRDVENIDLEETTSRYTIIRRCRVCRCGHYLQIAEPFKFNSRVME